MSTIAESVAKLQAYYRHEPGAPILLREFGFYCLDRWKAEGHLAGNEDLDALFGFDPYPYFTLGGLGGCEAGFCPPFETKVLEDRGDYELVQDTAGRGVLCFKGRRNGFMPTYVSHPVRDLASWEKKCLWRMDPDTPERRAGLPSAAAAAAEAASRGLCVRQYLVGGYMYLRSLIGPEDLLYKFYDDPDLIHACMKAWLRLADSVTAAYQETVGIDELQFDEDICYKCGPLISPEMMEEFLFPYYRALLKNVAARNRTDSPYRRAGTVLAQLATDGNLAEVIPLYSALGFGCFAPVEAAAGNDVVALRERYPDLLFNGGIDKRILASSVEDIDREIDRILPVMKAQGGFYPTCDHGVPEEVPFENYLRFRRRVAEFG